MKKIYTLVTILAASFAANAQVVISQVYAAGGNAGATYTNDFVELFNSSAQTVTLTGYTLQYASATGTFNNSNIQTLPSITIPAGGYYLIQQSGGTNGVALPVTPDLIPNTTDNFVVLALGAAGGKIALVNDNVNVVTPTDANVLDYVGYGSATAFEGTGATGAISTTTSISRKSDGCQDTNDNADDFIVGTIAPRNSQTPINICAASVKENNIEGLNIFPNPADEVLNITSNSTADKNVQLFDLTGKKVLDVTTVSTVNVSSLKAGIYVAKINEAGKTATRKVIIK